MVVVLYFEQIKHYITVVVSDKAKIDGRSRQQIIVMDSRLESYPREAVQPGGPTIKDHPLFASKPLMFALRAISNHLWDRWEQQPEIMFGLDNMSKQVGNNDSLVFALEYAA